MKKLVKENILEELVSLKGWSYNENTITKDYTFPDFSRAFAFITRVALLAEKMDHHPTFTNVYNKLNIALQTHDAGGVTKKDLKLAAQIEALTP